MIEVAGAPSSGAASGYRDMVITPDLATIIASPVRPDAAIVLADAMDAEGAPVAHAPRTVLKDTLNRLHDAGFGLRTASELEFYVFEGNFESTTRTGAAPTAPLTRFDADGHIAQIAQHEAFFSDAQSALEAAGMPVEYMKFEGGRGQAEIVLAHAEAFEMADRHVLYKQILREVAGQRGLCVSFMAMPFADLAGSGGHVHYSLYDRSTGESVMAGAEDSGLSSSALAFLAGQIRHAGAATAFLAPTVNAYKRLLTGQLAPACADWGADDRTCAFRIVGDRQARRIECRVPGADVNPYWAYAALIAAGLCGMQEAEPPPSDVRLPSNLHDALRALTADAAFQEALGLEACGHFHRYLSHEAAAFDRAVTEWERARYMERI